MLRQGFPHCAIFPTAASRRSLGRVSVPMWPFNLLVRIPGWVRNQVVPSDLYKYSDAEKPAYTVTVNGKADEDWCSIHTVLDEKRFWEIIGKLKELGAQGILVTPIEKMIL